MPVRELSQLYRGGGLAKEAKNIPIRSSEKTKNVIRFGQFWRKFPDGAILLVTHAQDL